MILKNHVFNVNLNKCLQMYVNANASVKTKKKSPPKMQLKNYVFEINIRKYIKNMYM
jgi:hypothetical protein